MIHWVLHTLIELQAELSGYMRLLKVMVGVVLETLIVIVTERSWSRLIISPHLTKAIS